MLNLLHNIGLVYKQTTLIPSKYDPVSQKKFKEKYETLEKELKEDDTDISSEILKGRNWVDNIFNE